ncbi:XRE family transcriptional regulator [Akkermansia muciniphila]|uniref:LexA family transcriptional regulator n=1 Tax=Akkermansia muciniphila TaxID=239935 RepID=UPI00319E342F
MAPTKEEIKKWLKASGMTREELAKKCGVNKRTVDLWLSSARDVPSKSLLVIQRLMQGEDDSLKKIHLPLNEEQWAVVCEAMKGQSFLEFVNTALQNAAKEKEAARKKFTPVETFTAPSLEAQGQIIGNIAAGNLADGDTIPQDIWLYRELEKGEYLLRVNGHSMEPSIPDGSVVIMKKYTIPPIPKPGTIVQYHDERGVTLKKLVRRKNPETGKMEYTLHPINPDFGDIEPMDGGKISGIYVETLDKWEKA